MVQQMCEDLIRLKPDLIITEKGISGKQLLYYCFLGVTVFFVHSVVIHHGTCSYSSKYENSTATFCYTSFLASTHARPSIAIKYTIIFDQYFVIIRIDPDDGPKPNY